MIETPALNLEVLKKGTIYTGSYKGLRYRVRKSEDEIEVYTYPEPWCFEKTPNECKTKCNFTYTNEGLKDAINWIYSQISY